MSTCYGPGTSKYLHGPPHLFLIKSLWTGSQMMKLKHKAIHFFLGLMQLVNDGIGIWTHQTLPLAHRGHSQPRQISETLCSWKALIRPAGMSHWGRAPTHSRPLLLLGSSDCWARASILTLPRFVKAVGHSSALPKAPCGHQIPREIDVRNCMSMYIYIMGSFMK